MLINVFEHLDALGKPSIQAALDAAQDGDRIYLPGAMVYQAPPAGWIIRKRVELFGDGPGKKDTYLGTVLVPGAQFGPVLVLEALDAGDLSNVYLHDFQISKPQGIPPLQRWGGDGILYSAGAARKVSDLVIERVAVFGLTGSAFSLLGYDPGAAAIVAVHMLDCTAQVCDGYGLTLKNAFTVNIMHCLFMGNGKSGCRAELSGVALYQCVLDGNDGSGSEGSLYFVNCHTARVEACRLLGFAIGGRTAVVCTSTTTPEGASGGAFVISGCYFEGTVEEQCVGISVPAIRQNGPVLVLPNRFLSVPTLLSIGQDVTGCVVFPQVDATGTGSIALPGAPNVGLVAVPSLNRPGGNAVSGLAIPSPDTDGEPTLNVQNGTLAWYHGATTRQLRAYVGDHWKVVQTGA